MPQRAVNFGLYLADRAWVVLIAMIALACIKLAAATFTPVSHSERTVIRID